MNVVFFKKLCILSNLGKLPCIKAISTLCSKLQIIPHPIYLIQPSPPHFLLFVTTLCCNDLGHTYGYDVEGHTFPHSGQSAFQGSLWSSHYKSSPRVPLLTTVLPYLCSASERCTFQLWYLYTLDSTLLC